MNKKMISQELYDNLCLSLGRNAEALKGDVGFITIKKRLERNARISFEGVEVETIYLEMAREALTRIVVVNGKKYDTTLDKIVLLDLAEALEAHQSEGTTAVEQGRRARQKCQLSRPTSEAHQSRLLLA